MEGEGIMVNELTKVKPTTMYTGDIIRVFGFPLNFGKLFGLWIRGQNDSNFAKVSLIVFKE